jgi:hypothetical protein
VRPALQELVRAPLRATRLPDGSLRVLTRIYSSSQVHLSASLLGAGRLVQTGSRLATWLHGEPARTVTAELAMPGTFPIRLTIADPGTRVHRLRITGVDPYGRRSTVVLTVALR